ncbi:MAG: AraC family transcriptional regulator [Christensenella sp.]|uniref:AraC family transcriptional regulator n=1 Tax=Christensenella sp. TaxID=1935934 RepID=UPI002B210F61|nr:AraC family transcriptional regulator [Christensenella sp.]MEA5003620.1 AraC family transcriptional regulator [Christensenella sp.]
MTNAQLAKELGLKLLTEGINESAEVTDGCVCDLLSWVMARGEAGMAWITVQTHLNVVAVACLHDFACVIVPEGIEVPQPTIDKAKEEGIVIYSSAQTSYALCCGLCKLGIGQ